METGVEPSPFHSTKGGSWVLGAESGGSGSLIVNFHELISEESDTAKLNCTRSFSPSPSGLNMAGIIDTAISGTGACACGASWTNGGSGCAVSGLAASFLVAATTAGGSVVVVVVVAGGIVVVVVVGTGFGIVVVVVVAGGRAIVVVVVVVVGTGLGIVVVVVVAGGRAIVVVVVVVVVAAGGSVVVVEVVDVLVVDVVETGA